MAERSDRSLELEAQQRGAASVVYVRGSAGMSEAEKLRGALETLTRQKASPIVLELTDMDFICSAGLGAIIYGHLKCRHYQGQIKLVSPRPAVRELLETTRLTKLFTLYDSVEDALGQ